MLKFNNNHIFTGYLKQLLASFNLPTYRVYTTENQEYFNKTGKEKNILTTIIKSDAKLDNHICYFPYIKDDSIQYYVDGGWDAQLQGYLPYYYNRKELNRTKNLKILNNIYDSYTHEYLGDYLRFHRDYLGIDLMPLYNCFSNKLCTNLYNQFKSNSGKDVEFDTDNTAYKIYMVPVKLFKEYTIAIECSSRIEMYCDFYSKYKEQYNLELKNRSEFYKKTYKVISNTNFNAPFLYDNLSTIFDNVENIDTMELGQKERDLKLFIKLPANNQSSIVILEGNYIGWNDSLLTSGFSILKENSNKFFELDTDHSLNFGRISNRFVTNYEGPVESKHISCGQNPCTETVKFNDHIGYSDTQLFKPITQLQLLKMNTGESYPFADRLIEYLLGNVITNEEELEDNIKRVQAVIELNGQNVEQSINTPTYYGLWENKIRAIIYDYFNEQVYKKLDDNSYALVSNSLNTDTINHDNLGYVTKDVEKYYSYKEKNENGKITSSISIAGIDLYTEEE